MKKRWQGADPKILNQWLALPDEPGKEEAAIIATEQLKVHGKGIIEAGGVRLTEDRFWMLYRKARTYLRGITWGEFWGFFLVQLRDLNERYQDGAATTDRPDHFTRTQNLWCTPTPVTTLLRQAGTLQTMLFSHPGNADMSYNEYYTPHEKDIYFGAGHNGYSVFAKDRDLLLFAPSMSSPRWIVCFRHWRDGRRVHSPRSEHCGVY